MTTRSGRSYQKMPPTDEDENCAICMDSYNNRSKCYPCLHQYCYDCIITWAEQRNTCPLCNGEIGHIIHSIKSEREYAIHRMNLSNSPRDEDQSSSDLSDISISEESFFDDSEMFGSDIVTPPSPDMRSDSSGGPSDNPRTHISVHSQSSSSSSSIDISVSTTHPTSNRDIDSFSDVSHISTDTNNISNPTSISIDNTSDSGNTNTSSFDEADSSFASIHEDSHMGEDHTLTEGNLATFRTPGIHLFMIQTGGSGWPLTHPDGYMIVVSNDEYTNLI